MSERRGYYHKSALKTQAGIPAREICYNVRMKKFILAMVAAVSMPTAYAAPAETLLDVDFSKAARAVDGSKRGYCSGMLPNGVSDNFSSWSGGRCTTTLMQEDGVKFLRFTADDTKGPVQYLVQAPKMKLPGFFRLTVKGRVRGGSLGLGLRLNPAPYTTFSSHAFSSPDWSEKTFIFHVPKKASSSVGLYLYPKRGDSDLCRVVLEQVDRSELARTIRRPPPSTRVFVSRRFLLGLPNGWNDDRNTETATATAFDDAGASTPVLRLSSERDKSMTVWGEPFQTSTPSVPHAVSFRCRGSGKWSAQVMSRRRYPVKAHPFNPGDEWRTEKFTFKPGDLDEAFAVKFVGKGELFLDDLRVGVGTDTPQRPFKSACALAPAGGEIAGISRIWFTDETPRVAWAAADAPAGAVLRLSFADLYGNSSPLADVPLKGGAFEKGTFDPAAAIAGRTGQFRVTAEVIADGKAVSAPDEFVFTRIPRPLGWGHDMPDSPFGIHMEPRPGTLAALKACGMNWTRFHDAATSCTGWWALEAEKGKWTFRDESIRRFRDSHVKIFAQLGTAPAWATHYNDLGCRNMGYFEKYLRPVDTNAWLNYVTTVVRRYRGVIDEYFVWNEPWGRWWKSAADIKYYDKDRAAQDFGELQSITYKAVKAVDPSIVVSGFNTYAGSSGADWTKGVAEGGGWETCDVVDYHIYTPNMRARRFDGNYAETAFSPLLEKHPKLDGKPVYMSEGQGTSTGSSSGRQAMSGLYSRIVPWEPETPKHLAWCADATCRYTLSLLADGDRRVFLYTAHGYQGLLLPPHFTVLVGADGYPYPSLAAYAVFTRALEGSKFAGKADYGADGCVYSFRHGNGSVVKLYTDLTPDEADALNAGTPLRDLYGNAYDRKSWFPGSILYASK